MKKLTTVDVNEKLSTIDLNEADYHRFKQEVGCKREAYSGARALHSSDPQ